MIWIRGNSMYNSYISITSRGQKSQHPSNNIDLNSEFSSAQWMAVEKIVKHELRRKRNECL